MIVVGYLCLVSFENLPTAPTNFDKIVHMSFHFGITLLWFLYLKFRNKTAHTNKALQAAFLFSFVYGVVLELCQELFTTSRKGDFNDIIANSFGALLAVILILIIKKFIIKNDK